MKKLLFLGSLFCLLYTGNALAGKGTAFNYDRAVINHEMEQLNQLEEYLNLYPGTTLAQMVSGNHGLASGIGEVQSLAGLNSYFEKVMGIPGFMWGCCLGFTGVLIVALAGKDEYETKQSIKGAIISVGFWVIVAAGTSLYYYIYVLRYIRVV